MIKKWHSFLLVSLLTLGGFFFKVEVLRAADCDDNCTNIEDKSQREKCVNDKIACLEGKIKETQNASASLSNEIAMFDTRIALTEAQIEKTKLEQVRTELEAEILTDRAASLSGEINTLGNLLESKITEAYRYSRQPSITMLLEENGFNDFINGQRQERVVQQTVSRLMFKKQKDKIDYEQQVEEREEKKVDLQKQERQLADQQKKLGEQKAEKNLLLSQTKNSESEYQRLLNQARTEIDSYARFASSQGGSTCLGSSPSSGDGGWFYSQRDPRWCKQYISRSDMTVGEVGCLLTSVSMILTKHGQSTSPASLAANSRYFFSNTAMMLDPPVPSGFSYRRLNYHKADEIDRELDAGRPVIVHVRTNNGYGGHFVVLRSGSGGSYKMHDPWNGPDLNFTDYYSVGMIDSMRIFTQ